MEKKNLNQHQQNYNSDNSYDNFSSTENSPTPNTDNKTIYTPIHKRPISTFNQLLQINTKLSNANYKLLKKQSQLRKTIVCLQHQLIHNEHCPIHDRHKQCLD